MSIDSRFTEAELQHIRSSKLLELPSEFVTSFVALCERIERTPGSTIYEGRLGKKLELMILVEGCLGVWDNSFDEVTIDALITRGQLIGDFEFLGFDGRSFKLICLARTVTARPKPELFKEFLDSLPKDIESKFYLNLARTLVDKLRAQNTLLKFRTNHYDGRLAKLFDNFTNDEWHYLTDLTNGYSTKTYEIDVLFTQESLRGFIEGDTRRMNVTLGQLIESNILSIDLYDNDLNLLGPALPTAFGERRFPLCKYFKVRVLDHDGLTDRFIK